MENKQVQKPYSTPELTVHGSIEKLTLKSGSKTVDVPIGSPCCDISS